MSVKLLLSSSYRLFISPFAFLLEWLEWFMAWAFDLSYHFSGSLGWSVLLLSALVNTLLLPLYFLGDRIQLREQAAQARLLPKLEELRRAFSGTTLYLLQKTLYRQNNYHPVYALRSSIGFAIQVPFFIAAYRFLSHLEALRGQSWGPIADLAAPDGLLRLPENILQANVLPWLMTLLNLLSSAAYLAQLEVRSKAARMQLWAIALLFLALLYRAPAALLLYWSFSNLYSLLKNLISASIKGGCGYWRLLWQQGLRLGLRTWQYIGQYLVSLPHLVLLEYILLTAGAFLFARFKVLDSLDPAAQNALFWGEACWAALIVVQVLRHLVCAYRTYKPQNEHRSKSPAKNPHLPKLRPKLPKPVFVAAAYSAMLFGAFFVPRLAFVTDYFGTVAIFGVTPAILLLAVCCALAPRLHKNRAAALLSAALPNLNRHNQHNYAARQNNKKSFQFGRFSLFVPLLFLGSTLALLGLAAFHSAALLRSSTGESFEAIPGFLRQLLPGLAGLAFGLVLLWFWLVRPAPQNPQNIGQKRSWLRQAAFWSSGILLLALTNSFILQYDYGVMTSWVFDQPEKLLIPWLYMFLALLPLPLLYGLWLFLLRRLHLFLPLVWIACASLWLGTLYYSRDLLNTLNQQKESEKSEFSSELKEPQKYKQTGGASEAPLNSVFSYSRNHTNVLIIMLDRFIGPYMQPLLQLEPSLKTDFAGFTWYKNTSSPGPSTISGLTALLGGHEYSPDNIGQLPGSLRDKVNQAYLMLPTLFEQNGFAATVGDPSWANFSWKGDLELFRERGFRAERLKGRYMGRWLRRKTTSKPEGQVLEQAAAGELRPQLFGNSVVAGAVSFVAAAACGSGVR